MVSIVTEGIDHAVDAFKKLHGLHHVIAFSGGADTELPGVDPKDPLQEQYASVQKQREVRIVHGALNKLRHSRIAVLTGGTRFGFPMVAAQVAKEMGLKTIGVFPKVAHDKGHVIEDLDLAICVHPQYGESAWGDESPVFCKLMDAAIVCGGGAGTLIEMAHLLKMNEGRLKNQLPVKFIIPIQGTGGVSDGLSFVWGKQVIKNACMPRQPVLSGLEAAEYIDKKIVLEPILP